MTTNDDYDCIACETTSVGVVGDTLVAVLACLRFGVGDVVNALCPNHRRIFDEMHAAACAYESGRPPREAPTS